MTNTRSGLWHGNNDRRSDAPLIPTFGNHNHANTGSDAEEIAKLRVENGRLQQIVAELLIANQQLRRRITEASGATEHNSSNATQLPYRHDS